MIGGSFSSFGFELESSRVLDLVTAPLPVVPSVPYKNDGIAGVGLGGNCAREISGVGVVDGIFGGSCPFGFMILSEALLAFGGIYYLVLIVLKNM